MPPVFPPRARAIAAGAAILMWLVLVTVSAFAADPGAGTRHVVSAGVVCPLETVQADAERLRRSTAIVPSRLCRAWPYPLPIVAVHSGPFRDADGDTFYIVQVAPLDESGGALFTIAWPGLNSNLPVRIGI